jgi:prepilin-type N-terminal cleavage/methylation domain-containing protein/prepilin-type processing-associated H-X9-DG protein
MKTHHSRPRPGFTLVELLVVILIIAVLAALALTGFSRMRMMADKVTSARNLSQLQLANTGYAGDHNGKYVPVYTFDQDSVATSSWFNNPTFLSHLKGDLDTKPNGTLDTSVPLSMLDPVAVRAKGNQYTIMYASYGYIETGMPGGSYRQASANKGYTTMQVHSPSRKAAFITATDWIVAYNGRFRWAGAGAVEGKSSDQKIAYRHNKKAVVVYYDGHIGEVSMEDLKAIDQKGGAGNIFWDAAGK